MATSTSRDCFNLQKDTQGRITRSGNTHPQSSRLGGLTGKLTSTQTTSTIRRTGTNHGAMTCDMSSLKRTAPGASDIGAHPCEQPAHCRLAAAAAAAAGRRLRAGADWRSWATRGARSRRRTGGAAGPVTHCDKSPASPSPTAAPAVRARGATAPISQSVTHLHPLQPPRAIGWLTLIVRVSTQDDM